MTRPLNPADRQRLRTPGNLWRALIPLLAIAALLVVFSWPHNQDTDGVRVIDPGPAIAAARQQAGFTVLVPSGLGERWRPTSTELVPGDPAGSASFRIGYVSPAGRYAELLQSADAPDAVAAQYGPLVPDGATSIDGVSWQQYQTTAGRRLLRHTFGKVTVIVTGSAEQPELAELATSVG
ncbi:MAG TPA: DUF4245 domain-containing protein [Jatrophihabitans sp.]|uniref:DUF4245 domain-containing protein n=1 Tax=Jatrophihabitans sp. TaxID=1932789 RepID=UPI002F17F4B5